MMSSFGVLLGGTPADLSEELERVGSQGYDMVFFPSRMGNSLLPSENFDLFKDSSFLRTSSSWADRIGIILPEEVAFGLDSDDPREREKYEEILDFDVGWIINSSFSYFLLPFPSEKFVNYARCIAKYARTNAHVAFWITVPLSDFGWNRFNKFRALCGFLPNVSISLSVGKDPFPEPSILEKFLGDLVFCAEVDSSCFVEEYGKPASLVGEYVGLLRSLASQNVHFMLDREVSRSQHFALSSLVEQMRNESTEDDKFVMAYSDVVQSPLQPLSQNLDSQVYEVFEKDQTKYVAYGRATFLALNDLKSLLKTSGRSKVVIMVMGAGRGPLIHIAVQALSQLEMEGIIYGVEKNVYAHMLLVARKRLEDGWQCVELVNEDMRTWDCPDKADIILSELLGSFGDNELSPECLDSSQRLLKDGGIFIPDRYNSFLAPVSCLKVYNELLLQLNYSQLERLHVVKLQRSFLLDNPKLCFNFTHPAACIGGKNNERFTKISFVAKERANLHGFAGYFDAHLYGDVSLSINPLDQTPGLISWFECFFPLAQPIAVERGQEIEVAMWRKMDSSRIWYEWALLSPTTLPIHNVDGRKQHMSLLI